MYYVVYSQEILKEGEYAIGMVPSHHSKENKQKIKGTPRQVMVGHLA